MKQSVKITLASMLATALVAGSTATAAFAKTDWSFDEQTGTLTITGDGAMEDFGPKDSDSAAPWSVNGYKVNALVIKDGVTNIGDNAFAGLDNLKSAVIPETITSIGDGAFRGCHSLNSFGYGNNKSKTVVVKGNVTHLGQDAFYGCNGMDDIYLEATDLHDYHFDTLASNAGWMYDFNNPQATTIHVAKGFGDHITLQQCESLYQWQRVAGDKAPIVADLDVAGAVKGNLGQQTEGAKAAASKKSTDKAAEDGLKATSTQNGDAQKAREAKGAEAAPAAKDASGSKAAEKAAEDGVKATSTQNGDAQKAREAKGAEAAPAAKDASGKKSADKAAEDGLTATSTQNGDAQKAREAKGAEAAPAAKDASGKKAAKKAKEAGELIRKQQQESAPKKRGDNYPGV